MMIGKRKHKNINGFTIMEMAIVLSALAILAATTLSLLAKGAEKERAEITAFRINYVKRAIRTFVRQSNGTNPDNWALPCPAGSSLAITNVNFGLATKDLPPTGGCTSAQTTTTVTSFNPNFRIYIGTIPVHTLNIEPLYMLDGWNRRMTYAVDEDMINPGVDPSPDPGVPGQFNNNPTSAAPQPIPALVPPPNPDPEFPTGTFGRILVLDTVGGDSTTGTNPSGNTEYAAAVIVSHGRNGHGAWRAKGGSTVSVSSPSTDEAENADNDNVFIFKSFTSAIGNYYDDFVVYITKWSLL